MSMGTDSGRRHTSEFLRAIGAPDPEPATTPFDPGYDPVTLEGHLEQSGHLMAGLKISMACWLIADEGATRRKVAAARRRGVGTVTGGGPFEIAATQGKLREYLDLCADIGFDAVECGEGFTDLAIAPEQVARMVAERGLGLEFELGRKHEGAFDERWMEELVELGHEWLALGARSLVIEGRESAQGVGLFDESGGLQVRYAERFVDEYGFRHVVFEAPTKASQFALLERFGPEVRLANVRIEELLRVEIYRRGLHSDAFATAPWRADANLPGRV
jgi:phosphosulfolactate synthase